MKKSIFFIFFFLIVYLLKAQNSGRIAYAKRISLPLDRSVYQRNASGNATIKIAIHLPYGTIQSNTSKYYIIPLDKLGKRPDPISYTIPPTTISDASLATNNGLFSKDETLPTGWYEIVFDVNVSYGNNRYTPLSESVKVGVGEVIVISGQSNAQGVPLGLNGGYKAFNGYGRI